MTSISIYTTQICFVYKWTQISTGKWYIGSHTSKSAHPEDGYICGSKIVKPMIKEYPEDWTRIILETGTKEDMLLLEHELLKCLNAAQSEYSYNRNNGFGTFSTSGIQKSTEHKAKLSKANIGKHHTSETRIKIGLSSVGRIPSQETILKLKKPKSIEHCNKLKVPKSEQHRANMRKPKHVIICPHCNKSGGSNLMKRYHFDNCKFIS